MTPLLPVRILPAPCCNFCSPIITSRAAPKTAIRVIQGPTEHLFLPVRVLGNLKEARISIRNRKANDIIYDNLGF